MPHSQVSGGDVEMSIGQYILFFALEIIGLFFLCTWFFYQPANLLEQINWEYGVSFKVFWTGALFCISGLIFYFW